MWVVSACLVGIPCRYNGEQKSCPPVQAFLVDKPFVALCPEVLGGLETPRPPAEISGDRVINTEGADVTAAFERGADETLQVARNVRAHSALLKEGSPSCGVHRRYDGTFTGRSVAGPGKTAALLAHAGLRVISEEDLE